MTKNYTPGVRIEHILTEPKRVLHTGAPVFLGLIPEEALLAHNARYADKPDECFIAKPIPGYRTSFIARRQGYVRLPERLASPLSDPMSQNRGFIRSGTPQPMPADTSPQSASARSASQTTEEGEELQLRIRSELSDKPQRFTVWRDFETVYAELKPFGFLVNAVRGFFENDGRLCYVQLIGFRGDNQQQALAAGLKTLEIFNDYDLVCVPDLVYQALPDAQFDLTQLTTMQRWVIDHCDVMGDRIAILDSLPPDSEQTVEEQRKRLQGNNGALYYPWLQVPDGPTATSAYVPPCGHVAGIIAQTDRRIGVYKAPANEVMDGVLNLQVKLNDVEQSPLNRSGINCLRSFPRRGIRIWGARTLSNDLNWRYINVRRIFTTAARWIERNMADVVFEPNTPELWARIVRDLTFYFSDLLEQGALAGRAAGEAFYVKCNAETNPPETREIGQVITEIGLAVDVPAEFIVVRIMHGMTGVRIIGPA